MSYIDRLQNKFEIITYESGTQGTVWTPLLSTNYQKEVEYSGTKYEFIDRIGSLFVKRLPKGRTFTLEFSFTGEDNDKIANNFEIAARYWKAWSVTHPFYGKFNCQPLNLKMNNSGLMTTTITVQVVETVILENNRFVSTQDAIQAVKESINKTEVTQVVLVDKLPISQSMLVKDSDIALSQTSNIGKIIEKAIKTQDEFKAFQNSLSKALNEVSFYQALTIQYIGWVNKLISLPATISADIGTRFRALQNIFEMLGRNVVGVAAASYFEKLFYNLVGGICITRMAEALTVKNANDFQSKSQINLYIVTLQENYNLYLQNVYSFENDNFILDHDTLFNLHLTVEQTIFYLYSILLESKQERTYFCERDTNLILLAHKLYGEATDSNIELIKSINRIGIYEMINIKKDRQIIYYV